MGDSPAARPSMKTFAPAAPPRTLRLPWPFNRVAAAPDGGAAFRITTLTGTIAPTSTSNVVVSGCQPARVSVSECMPGNRSSTYTGVSPAYAPSSQADAPPGSVVTYAPPCGPIVAAGCGCIEGAGGGASQ